MNTLLRDPILYIEGLAFADDAFENEIKIAEDVYNLTVPPDYNRLIPPWKRWSGTISFEDRARSSTVFTQPT